MAKPIKLTIPQQIADHLKQCIMNRKWENKMPGRQYLSAELGQSPRNIQKALRILENEGLIVSQGRGKKSLISLPKESSVSTFRVAILAFDRPGMRDELLVSLRNKLEDRGYYSFFADETLEEIKMDPDQLDRVVLQNKANCWVVLAGSKEILEWFPLNGIPCLAIAGQMQGVKVAGVSPDKAPVFREIARYLVSHGHSKISCLCRRQLREPTPARSFQIFLDELKRAEIAIENLHLPDWKEDKDGLMSLLDSLFQGPSPTALVIDEPFLFYATYHYLADKKIAVPKDVSLVCTDPDSGFRWCHPSISHVRWNKSSIVNRILRWIDSLLSGEEDVKQIFQKAIFERGGTIGKVR